VIQVIGGRGCVVISAVLKADVPGGKISNSYRRGDRGNHLYEQSARKKKERM
jgi:hypothetical protein